MSDRNWTANQQRIMKTSSIARQHTGEGQLSLMDQALLTMTDQVEQYLRIRCPGDEFVFDHASGLMLLGIVPSPDRREFYVSNDATHESFSVFIERDGVDSWYCVDTLYALRHENELNAWASDRLNACESLVTDIRIDSPFGLRVPLDLPLTELMKDRTLMVSGRVYYTAESNLTPDDMSKTLSGFNLYGTLQAIRLTAIPDTPLNDQWLENNSDQIIHRGLISIH